MTKARKAHGDKVILDDVTLSFYPGAKIGVVGPNGAGKSTILKIMAGLDQPSNGEARLAPGYTVGILLQEPPLNEDKTVLGNVEEGVGEIKAQARPLQRDLRRDGRARRRLRRAARRDGQAAGGHRRTPTPGTSTPSSSRRWTPCAARRRTPTSTVLSGGERRRVALCKLLLQKPDLLLLDEPTNHLDAESVLWLEQHLAKYPGAVLAVTHDRYFLDNVAAVDRSRSTAAALYPYEGNYSTYLEKKAERLKVQGKKDAKLAKRLKDELEWVRSNAKGRQTKTQGPAGPLRGDGGRGRPHPQARLRGDPDPAGPAPGQHRSSRPTNLTKGFGDRVLIDDLSLHPAAQRHRRRHRPQRRRQDHAVQDDRRPRGARRAARSRSARPSRSPTSTRAAAASTRRRTSGRSCPTASTTSRSATSRCRPGPTSRSSASRARTSRSRPACSPVASATGSTSRSPSSRAATCCCSTSRPTTSTSRRSARWRTRCSSSPAAPS